MTIPGYSMLLRFNHHEVHRFLLKQGSLTLVIVRWLSETTESRLASHLNLIPTEQTLINGKNAASNKDGVRIIKSASLKINGKMKGEPIIVEDDNDLFPTVHISSSGAKIQSGYQDINYSKNTEGKAENLF